MNYLILRLIVIIFIPVVTQIIIVVIAEVFTFNFIIQFLELEGLTRIPVDGTRDKLLLDVFSEMIIELQSFLELVIFFILLVITVDRLGGIEEVKETLSRDCPFYDTSLFRIWAIYVRVDI